MNYNRSRVLKNSSKEQGIVIYWMSRDQRVDDNWALLKAEELAELNKTHVEVVFILANQFLEATLRQYDFMIKGLQDVEKKLRRLNIPFRLLLGNPTTELAKFTSLTNTKYIVTDFDPLKIKQQWKSEAINTIEATFIEVDAHNIIPCWHLSDKQEYAAYTIRPKIEKKLLEFLVDYPILKKQSLPFTIDEEINWQEIYKSLKIDTSVKPVDVILPGEISSLKYLENFIEYKLDFYKNLKNDPTKDFTSNLSPLLHFGHISSQRIALEIERTKKNPENKKAFLEELIVRKELSDNFCFYNQNYDNQLSFPDWAKKSIEKHKNDKKEYIYTPEEFETAKTHDRLWNAAQKELIKTGKMHGFMRMYWAKKNLEWSKNIQEAQKISIYLNDKYELDGRDPNGYAGIAWSIGGVHDRAWPPRPVFGNIRYMNFNGCKRKFDVEKYISKFE